MRGSELLADARVTAAFSITATGRSASRAGGREIQCDQRGLMPRIDCHPDLHVAAQPVHAGRRGGEAVMLGLLLASVWTWAIIFTHSIRLKRSTAAPTVRAGLLGDQRHRRVPRPARLGAAADCCGHVRGARRMAPLDQDQAGRSRRNPRTPRQPDERRRRAELDRLSDRLNILATVGSVAPFVGLFGTVWGIMRSFTAIAGANNTPGGGRSGHRRSAVRDRHRPVRGHPGGHRLQPADPASTGWKPSSAASPTASCDAQPRELEVEVATGH